MHSVGYGQVEQTEKKRIEYAVRNDRRRATDQNIEGWNYGRRPPRRTYIRSNDKPRLVTKKIRRTSILLWSLKHTGVSHSWIP